MNPGDGRFAMPLSAIDGNPWSTQLTVGMCAESTVRMAAMWSFIAIGATELRLSTPKSVRGWKYIWARQMGASKRRARRRPGLGARTMQVRWMLHLLAMPSFQTGMGDGRLIWFATRCRSGTRYSHLALRVIHHMSFHHFPSSVIGQ